MYAGKELQYRQPNYKNTCSGGIQVGIQITTDQVLALAPDASSVSAGKKQSNIKHWKGLGQNGEALWGECQGSALYQVRVETSTLTINCSCPSRKQPCKHGLGLLLLAANSQTEIPESEPPEWIVAWLTRRTAASKRKETMATKETAASPSAAQTKSIEKRKAQVAQGIEHLDLWLNDLIRNGLGSLETQPATFWENQAKQMVDAQAPGIASRILRMAELPNASSDWPEKLLTHCGQLALLSEAYQRLDQHDPALQEDIRQQVGWTVKEDEVLVRGEHVSDDWLFLGQQVEAIERGRAQRTWLLGISSGRAAMLVQFSIAGNAFSTVYPFGVRQKATLVFWPGAAQQRAIIETRQETMTPLQERLPGKETIEAFLNEVTTLLAKQPWQARFLCTLCDIIPIYEASNDRWWIRDKSGQALPLAKGEYWLFLALSGGQPVDFVGEWNGETVSPLGTLVEGHYYRL